MSDKETIYITIEAGKEIDKTVDYDDNIIIDLDEDGNAIGVEILSYQFIKVDKY